MRTYDYIAKPCTLCKQVKSLTEFNRDRNMIDGHSPRCRGCQPKRDFSKYAARRRELEQQYQVFGRDPKYGNTWELLHGALKTIERVRA